MTDGYAVYTKYDAVVPRPSRTDTRVRGLARIPNLIVAGSTHAPEERWLLEALAALPGNTRLLLVPRHPQRARALLRLAHKRGLRAQLWSRMEAGVTSSRVMVLDEVGWLPILYGHAAVAFIGGSLVDRGGHNPLEAAAPGRPLVFGPHMQHFQGIAEDLLGHQACIQLRHQRQLTPVLQQLLTDPGKARHMGNRAAALVQSRRGCATYYAQRLASYLLDSGSAVD